MDQIAQTFQTLHLDVDSTDIAAGEMKDQTEQQMKAIHQFDEHIQQISEATRNIANRITVSFREIERMNKVVDELRQSTDAFIVE